MKWAQMDRMKIIKRRLSMSLRSARPVDENLSELAEHAAADEPPTTRENGEETRFECVLLAVLMVCWMCGDKTYKSAGSLKER